MTERHARILARLAELGVALAERVCEDALAAEDPEQRARLAKAFHSVSRSVRQNLALEARLVREQARAEDEASRARARALALGQDAADDDDPAEDLSEHYDAERIARRKDEARRAVQRLIWSERESELPDQDYLTDLLDQRLDLYACSPTYGLDPLDEHIAELCGALGLRPEAARRDWRDLPDPEFEYEDTGHSNEVAITCADQGATEIDWRSSG